MRLYATSSQNGCPPASPELAMAGRRRVSCIISYAEVLSDETFLNPKVAKIGGLQSQGAKGKAVANLLRTLGHGGSGVLRLSRRVNNMASNRPYPLNSLRVEIKKGSIFIIFV